ncbi:MAG: GNAT family N-acetyltransferase [Synergistaceae bacterium]|nr:GNAT family N-acetyltransferase [Synergistaceae bacterium]
MTRIINIRECPEWVENAADYCSSRWSIDKNLYLDSMNDSVSTKKTVPRWYLMLRDTEIIDTKIIGAFGLIDNDFMVRTDLCPWLCALYIEPAERGRRLGAALLAHGRREAAVLGFEKVYLNTDHVGYYEKYGWRYIGDFARQSGSDTRVYEADVIHELEEMAAFFDTRADIYDSHMLDDLGLDEFYATVAACFDRPVHRLLDLGCGTGLELEQMFSRFPDMEMTGIDMSSEMLRILEAKYSRQKLRLIRGSYFDVELGGPYDSVVSTYSLHHFSEESKLELYRMIYAALEPGGMFVFGDYTVTTAERQRELIAAAETQRREQAAPEDEIYHLDIPFTSETEIRLMKAARFASAEVARQWENASIIVARK